MIKSYCTFTKQQAEMKQEATETQIEKLAKTALTTYTQAPNVSCAEGTHYTVLPVCSGEMTMFGGLNDPEVELAS